MIAAAKQRPADQVEPLVVARNVHKSFGDNEVLKGIDLDVCRERPLSSWDLPAPGNPLSCGA